MLPTEDGCWVLIGDVAGKGTDAAAVSVAMRHAVRGLTREIEEPEEVLARVNELLLGGASLNDFATAVLIRLRRDGELGWRAAVASAGHPPAVHVTADGPTLLGGGAVLGAWEEAAVHSHEVDLGPRRDAGPLHRRLARGGPGRRPRRPRGAGRDGERAGAAGAGRADRAAARRRGPPRRAESLRDDLVILAVRPEGGPTGPAWAAGQRLAPA